MGILYLLYILGLLILKGAILLVCLATAAIIFNKLTENILEKKQ